MIDLAQVLQALRAIIADPTANLTAAIFLLSAAVLLVLILMVAVTVLLLPSGRLQERARFVQGSGSRRIDARSRVNVTAKRQDSSLIAAIKGSGWTVPILVALAIASAYAATSADMYCVSCHGDVRDASSENTDTVGVHASVSCTACHEESTELLVNSVRRLSDVGAKMGLGQSLYTDSVTSQQCLGCHESEIENPSKNELTGVAMSHAEPLEAGWACLDCHLSGGHSGVDLDAVMSSCLQCHDAERADASCPTCHTKDTSAASGLAQDRVYGRAEIVRRDCEGCHSMDSCDACHGLRMPHSDEFLRTHPRYAGFDKKEMCYEKCHSAADCGACHGAWNNHLPSFKQDHKRLPRDTGCPSCHDQHEGPMCDLCHDFDQ